MDISYEIAFTPTEGVTMYDTSYDGTAVRGSRHLSFASADFPLSGARLRRGLLRVLGLL